MQKPFLFAHRGIAARAPENTMAAFRLAVEAGADGIETDVHLSRDGRLALIHDENTLRTTGTGGKIAELNWAELRELDAGAWYDDSFAGERIPELAELLELVKPTTLKINLELKNSYVRYAGLEQAVLAELRRTDMLGRVVFSSFNHASLALIRQLEPEAETALLYDAVLHRTAAYALSCGAGGIHPYRGNIDEALVEECHRAGIQVRPWTVNKPEDAQRLAALGVDAVISDCPDELFD